MQLNAVRQRGRPRDPEKDRQILEAAVALFMERGFEASSMDAIAEQAGVSKVTLYARFRDKESLFTAALAMRCSEFVGPELFEPGAAGGVRAQLLLIASRFLQLVVSHDGVAMMVLISKENARSPQLAALFFEVAVLPLKRHLESFLLREAAAGRLAVADPEGACWRFLGAVKGKPHLCAMLGLALPEEAELHRHVEACVDDFLRLHAGPKLGEA